MVTKKDIQNMFPNAGITQYGYKQLFKVNTSTETFLVSYKTIVGKYDFANQKWLITKKKYSVTTTRQINFFLRTLNYSTFKYSDEI